jgi:hypothetical protein
MCGFRFSDPPEWYGIPQSPDAPKSMLLSMDLERPVAPPDYNELTPPQTETMVGTGVGGAGNIDSA